MADYCDYELHVRGTKKAALMVYAVMRSADLKTIKYEGGADDEYTLHFDSCCKWEPDAYCDREWDGKAADLTGIGEQSMREEQGVEEFTGYRLEDMSGMLHCEIEIYAASPEEGWCSFAHYKDGETLESEFMGEGMEDYDEEEPEEEAGEAEGEEARDFRERFSF